MQLNKIGNMLWALGLATALTACGGSSGGANGQGSGSTDDPGATPDSGNDRTTPVLLLGLNEGAKFSSGFIQSDSSSLDFGDETSLLVTIVNKADSNNIYTDDTTVTFTSECVSKGKASLENDGVVETSNGIASVKYTDLGCSVSGQTTDKVTARITAIDSESVSGSASATTSLAIAEPTITLTANKTNLNAGELTNLSLKITNSDGDEFSFAEPMSIGFTSSCVDSQKATLSQGLLVDSSNGSINTLFQDNGCGVVGGTTETIKATIRGIGSETVANGVSASAVLEIGPPIADDIVYESASPENIDINRLGANNYSLVSFRVLSDTAIPLENHEVRATLSAQNGGASLENATIKTDSNGVATFKVISGKTKAYVEVFVETNIYSADGSTVAGTLQQKSAQIEIDKGLPTQDSFTLSATTLNPQSADVEGTEVTIRARLNDLSGNPVKDGTRVSFEADKTGTITSFCTTENGSCTATWKSNPNNASRNDDYVTIIAHADGEMIENDPNKNGFWDLGEPYSVVGEVLMDANDDGDFDLATDSYIDANGNNLYDTAADLAGVYKGVSCSEDAANADTGAGNPKHCEQEGKIWRKIQLINASGDGVNISLWEGVAEIPSDGTIAINEGQASIRILITDENGRTPPQGTQIALETDNGEIVAGDDIKEVPNTYGNLGVDAVGNPNLGFAFTAVLRKDDEPSVGKFTVKVTTVDGFTYSRSQSLSDEVDAVSSTVNLNLGNGSGVGFQDGVITSTKSNLNAGDSTELTVTVVNISDSNALYTDATSQVTFTSTCASVGKAEFKPATVSGKTGTLKTTYIDKGCAEQSDDVSAFSDTVVATLVNDNSATAMVSFNVQPIQVGSLEYQSATPTKIALQGFGNASLPTVSDVQFKLEDTQGNPIINRPVRFELDQSAGGASLISAQANTDINGIATARLKSGRVPASVRVRAIADKVLADGSVNGEIRVLSEDVSMSNSLPTQDGFILEANVRNPHAYDVNGTEVEFKATLKGRDNVAVDDGTVVKFLTDGNGTFVQDQCETESGSCTVVWRSGRSDGYDVNDQTITVMARAVGEAGFVDSNGNGVWDLTETFNPVAEAYLDANDNGTFDAGVDRMADYNGDGVVNPASDFTSYRGIACSEDAIAAGAGHCDNLVEVWKSIQLVNSHGGEATVTLLQGSTAVPIGGTIAIDTPATLSVLIQDENGNTPPAGTVIQLDVGNGSIAAGSRTSIIPSIGEDAATDGYRFSLVLRGDDTPSTGHFSIKVTSRTGVVTEQLYILDDDDDAVSSTVALKLGNGSGVGFQNGVITSSKSALKAGETAELTLTVVNSSDSDALYTEATSQVMFTSTCASSGKALFSPAIVSSDTGNLTTTYIDKGCAEESDGVSTFSDTVIATLVNDNTVNAMVSFNVQPAKVGSLEYQSATSTSLALQGFGRSNSPTVSEVQFKLADLQGNPIVDRPVRFELDGLTGGAELLSTQLSSDLNGLVTARLRSGNIPASVRVKAIADQVDDAGAISGNISVYSEMVLINTKLPTQKGFKLEAAVLNPYAYDVVGTEVEIKATLKDRNNVSVDDGTIVKFATDNNGYFDENTCETKGGTCKVTWRSSRSADYNSDYIITILARTEGEVGFIDADGNGVWDLTETFYEVSEAYLDANDDADFDLGVDVPFDYNSDGIAANPASDFTSYRGVACSEAAINAGAGHCEELVEVWQTVSLLNSSGGTAQVGLYSDGGLIAPGSEIDLTGTKSFTIQVRDAEGNLPPAETKVSLTVNNGSIVTGASEYTVASQFRQPTLPYEINLGIKADSFASIDDFIIEVENPDGTISRQVYELNDGVEEGPADSVDLAIGSGVDAAFDESVASVTIGAGSTLPSGGSTTVKVDIVDKNDSNASYTNFTNVYFTSPCVQLGLAEFSPSIVQASGSARSTYKDKGCAEEAVVDEELKVLLVELDDQNEIDLVLAQALTNIKVAPAQVGTIEFMSTLPEAISLKGLGSNAVMPEISQISFRVLDKTGQPMAGRDVRFSLSNELPGVELTRTTASSDANGIATVQLLSGYSHGNVSVVAEIDILDELGVKVDEVRVQSSSVSITTGLPTQQSFTLSLDSNSARGWDASGSTVRVTASLADQYGNFVPDGTQVVFVAEGGAIGSSCTTIDGSCFVNWESQNYRPLDGIATINARVEGVADFQDSNSNGLFDIGEAYEYYGEAYLDADDSGTYNPSADYLPDLDIDDDGTNEFNWVLNDASRDHENKNFKEEFYDHNGDEVFTSRGDKSGNYQGVTCSDDAKAIGHCSELVQLTKSVRLVMSNGSNAFIEGPFAYDTEQGVFDTANTLSCVDVQSGVKVVGWRVSDSQDRRNKLPSSSSIRITGDDVDVLSESGTGTVQDIVNIAYPHATPAGTAEQKALYRESYLFNRGHMVFAQVDEPDEPDGVFGKLNMTVSTVSGIEFSNALQVGIRAGSLDLMNGLEVLNTVDISGGSKTLTVKVANSCGFALEKDAEITVSTNNGVLSNPVGVSNHVQAIMDGSIIRATLTDQDFEGEPNTFTFDLAPDGTSNSDNFSLVISTSNGRIGSYTVQD